MVIKISSSAESAKREANFLSEVQHLPYTAKMIDCFYNIDNQYLLVLHKIETEKG